MASSGYDIVREGLGDNESWTAGGVGMTTVAGVGPGDNRATVRESSDSEEEWREEGSYSGGVIESSEEDERTDDEIATPPQEGLARKERRVTRHDSKSVGAPSNEDGRSNHERAMLHGHGVSEDEKLSKAGNSDCASDSSEYSSSDNVVAPLPGAGASGQDRRGKKPSHLRRRE